MLCPTCGASASEGAHYCAADGTELAHGPSAVVVGGCRCGAGPEEIDDQGFCGACGRHCGAQPRDHCEVRVNSCFGGVTDIGRRHTRNEDDMALAMTTIDGEPLHVLVVCDGVSNSDGGDRASRAAAEATRDALGEAINAGSFDPEKALTEAILKAHVAVCALEPTPRRNADPPESTIVAAVVFRGVATIGWVGDSRAYWFSSDDARLLSHDHSWINEVVDAGEMTLEEAETHHEAHAITRCLGANDPDDTPEDSAPTVTTFAVPSAGRLLLCTDGLWNYAGQTDALAEVIGGLPAPADATALCRGLIDFALAQGGHDNITAVALDL